ncbi:rac GTPase-activating protein 1 [Trichonephila clavipes]|nr:rac GTPase-activating protein 1 [Trichonephila clavipes]
MSYETHEERRIVLIKEVLLADGKAIDNQTKERLFLLSNTTCRPQLDSQTKLTTIEESIESLISPSDIDDTDEELNPNISRRRKRRSKGNKRSSGDQIEKRKKFEESEAFRIEETEDEFRMDLDNMPEKNTSEFRSNSEPNSTSLVEPPPQAHHSDSGQVKSPTYDIQIHNTGTLSSNKHHGRYSTGGKLNRIHAFVSKTVIRTEKCYPCGNMIKFCKQALKCTDCRITCHPECKDRCPLPCIPVTFTPTKGPMGTIGDYTSSTPPMIPSLIVHCVNEIESRDLKEIGLYRISGSERDVKDLNQKLLKGRSVISLNKVDIHAICGTIKEFLRSLKEPLVTRAAWQTFVDAAEQKDETMSLNLLYEAVCELPQPNKETLAFLVLHFQRVAEAYECRMPLENLAKVFGPTIVGYSSAEPADSHMLTETKQQCQADLQPLIVRRNSILVKYNKLFSYNPRNRTSKFLKSWSNNQRLKRNNLYSQDGNKVFPTCVGCSACQASPKHILDCLGLSKQDLYKDPLIVLDFLRVKSWTWYSLARHGDEQQHH